jgi:hypothetical protein
MEDPDAASLHARRPRRLDPKAASLAGFLSPHPNNNSSNGRSSSGSTSASGGGWKARLKERCLNRVRQERERLVQGMRGLASPPPPPPVAAADAAAMGGGGGGGEDAAGRLAFLPSPPPLTHNGAEGGGAGAGGVEAGGGRRSSTPSSISGAALSILQAEMRRAARRPEGEGEGEAMMAIAEERDEGEEEEGEGQLSPEEHWELMRCIEEALAAEVGGRAEEWDAWAGEYSQLEHAEVEGSVAQLYDYEELPADGAWVRVWRCVWGVGEVRGGWMNARRAVARCMGRLPACLSARLSVIGDRWRRLTFSITHAHTHTNRRGRPLPALQGQLPPLPLLPHQPALLPRQQQQRRRRRRRRDRQPRGTNPYRLCVWAPVGGAAGDGAGASAGAAGGGVWTPPVRAWVDSLVVLGEGGGMFGMYACVYVCV